MLSQNKVINKLSDLSYSTDMLYIQNSRASL
jgi:hypothetical protein